MSGAVLILRAQLRKAEAERDAIGQALANVVGRPGEHLTVEDAITRVRLIIDEAKRRGVESHAMRAERDALHAQLEGVRDALCEVSFSDDADVDGGLISAYEVSKINEAWNAANPGVEPLPTRGSAAPDEGLSAREEQG